MKGLTRAALALSVLAVGCSAWGWTPFVIRQSSQGSISPVFSDTVWQGKHAERFVVGLGGQMAGWGTSQYDGLSISELPAISTTRLDDGIPNIGETAGDLFASGPYFAIWIFDGSGDYAAISNVPSTTGLSFDWNELKNTKALVTNYSAGFDWGSLKIDSLVFGDLANYVIGTPSSDFAVAGSNAPRELTTNRAYGFAWVFGDYEEHYRSDSTGYVMAVPEPFTVGLGIAGLLAAFGVRRRRRA